MNFIFDFDGTLADSLDAMMSVFNKHLRPANNPITHQEVQTLRGMTSRRALKKLGVKWWQIPKLLMLGMPDFYELIPSLQSFDGMSSTLKKLHARGDQLYIVTSNTDINVQRFLKAQGLEGYFSDIVGGSSLFKKAKDIKKLIKKHSLHKKDTVYVGDETRDISAAKGARIKVVSVTWGFNTSKVLQKKRPHFLIHQPNELLAIAEKLS
jgi:phosphoglycolate phosphatase-like HAD superfamily hydrolase